MLDQCFPSPSPIFTEARKVASGKLADPEEMGHGFDRKAWDALAEFEIFRMPFSEEVGGLGLSSEEICDVLEGLGAGTPNNSLLFAAGAHLWAVIKPLVDFGSPELQERYLEPLMSGRMIGAHAASEAGAGSDVMSMQTRYEEREDGFVLNGSKMWVTNAPQADLFLVFATSDPRLHYRGISGFLVERDTPGFEVAKPEKKMGLNDAPLATLFLEDVVVPKERLLGRQRMGARIFQTSLAWERTFIQAPQLGAMRRQIERVVAHAQERQQFGKPIARFQAVSHRIVDMFIRYWESRLVLRMVADRLVNHDDTKFAAMSKLVLGEKAVASHIDALKLFGGSGYMCEMGIEQDVRDALGGTIYSGTSDLQRNILAAALGL